MRIVVDKLPHSCDDCMFMGWNNLVRCCRIKDIVVEKMDEFGHRLYNYRDERCPLVEFNDMIEIGI